MATVNVLIIVDVEGAQTSGLQQNVYLVDTNKYMGSYNQGQVELVTVLEQGDTIIWSVAPIDPGTNVAIQNPGGFTGPAIGVNVTPVAYPNGSWGSTFAAAPYVSGNQFQYSVVLTFDGGDPQTFDPFLECK